jgi:hypothetical protein
MPASAQAKTATPTTPGPWRVSHSGYANAPFVIFAGDRAPNYKSNFPLSGVNAIAEVFSDESPAHKEQEANAFLIAAAPSLLAALEIALDHMRATPSLFGTGCIQRAESAIALVTANGSDPLNTRGVNDGRAE